MITTLNNAFDVFNKDTEIVQLVIFKKLKRRITILVCMTHATSVFFSYKYDFGTNCILKLLSQIKCSEA